MWTRGVIFIFAFLGSLKLNAQIKLNGNGFNDVQLGKNIMEVRNVVAFSSLRDKNLFQVFPFEKDFFVWQPEDSILFDNIKIRYVFISADTSGIIVKISMWLDDPNHQLAAQLTRIYGEPKYKAETGSMGLRNRDITIWDLSPYTAAFLAGAYQADPVLKFQVSKLDFYYPLNLNKISIHYINPRFQRE